MQRGAYARSLEALTVVHCSMANPYLRTKEMTGLLQEQYQENNQMHNYLYRMGKTNTWSLLRWKK